jgi:3-hydroxyisobutyrate dehydrogenase
VDKMKKVGLIGVGAMGKGLLKNLIKNGCEVLAYDISEKGKEQVQNLGGFVANHPREVIRFSNIIFLSLPGPKEINELFLGAEGIAEVLTSDTIIMDLSTVDPTTTREMAAICREYDSYYFDCPVSGGPTGADEGTLTIMVGGPKGQFKKIEEYLHYVGSNIQYIGESGIAQALKLCHNMLVAANIVALGEAFATGVKQGLHVEDMNEVFTKGMSNSRSLEYFGPNIVKDLSLFVNMTRQVGVPSFIGATVYNLYHAAKIKGKGHLDHTAVCQIIEDLASVKIVEDFTAQVN